MEKKEAMKILKDFHDKSALFSVRTALDTIIPELKESEDEKIRKDIVFYIAANHKDDGEKARWLYWLEKLSEQKSAWSEEDEAGLGDALWAVQQARTLAKDENDMGNLWYAEKWLNSLKSRLQPNQYWSKEDEKIYQSILDDTVQENQLDDKQTNWLKSLKDRVQPEQEWNEGDNVRLQRIIDFLWKNRKGDTDTIYQQEQDIDWLKSIRPQNYRLKR